MKTIHNPNDETVRVVSTCGMFTTHVEPDETRTLPEALFLDACLKGCVPAGDNADEDNPATEVDESRIAELKEAIGAVLDEGDPEQLTKAGCPKASILQDLVGDHTADERQQAYDEVLAERGVEDAS